MWPSSEIKRFVDAVEKAAESLGRLAAALEKKEENGKSE